MRTITSLMISCLIMSAGCVEPASLTSPYEAAERGWQERESWRATLIADAMAELQPLIDQANEELRALDGVIYVDVQEFERVVFFEKDGSGWLAQAEMFSYNPPVIEGPIPEGLISEEWTDRFALAQEFSGRCEVGADLTRIDLHSPTPFEVTIRIRITGTRRDAIAGEPLPTPKPPDGYSYWHHDERSGGGTWHVNPFRISIPKLPGEIYQPGEDELADQAAAMLAETEPASVYVTGKAVYRYFSEIGEWHVDLTNTEPIVISPESLDWSHGIRNGFRVFAPK